jgi:hypothetical protein
MPTTFGSLRRLLLAPSPAEVSFAGRGFPVTPTGGTPEDMGRLEAAPLAVVSGFEWGIDASDVAEVRRRLALVQPEYRGVACAGVAMAFTVLDAVGLRGRARRRTRELLLGPGRPHLFPACAGIGYAMARLPRPLWANVMPDLTGTPYYPAVSWFAVDGYAFHLAYFHTKRWVHGREVPQPYPWEGSPDYFLRAFDQGIGRALWFTGGGAPAGVAAAVDRFPVHRRADLWSGVGLAAGDAGGCGAEGLAALRAAAGEYHAELAQGAVFAVKAREHAGFVPPHTALATTTLTGLSVAAAVGLADAAEVPPRGRPPARPASPSTAEPAYEGWRRRVRAHFRAPQTVS